MTRHAPERGLCERDMAYGETARNTKIEVLSAFGVSESVLGYAAERTFDPERGLCERDHVCPGCEAGGECVDLFQHPTCGTVACAGGAS